MAEIDISNLDELVAFAAEHKFVLVDFHATWCGPCINIAPYVHKKCSESSVALAKVDVDVADDVATKYGVEAMPTFIVIDSKGKEIQKVTGGSQSNVDKLVEFILSQK